MLITKGVYDKRFNISLADGSVQEVILKPLPAKYLPKLFKISKIFDNKNINDSNISDDEKNSKMLELLSEDNVLEDIAEVVTVTIKKSYPEMEDSLVDDFVTINLFTLFPLVFEVNFRSIKTS